MVIRFVRVIAVFVGLFAVPAAWACSCHQLKPDEFVAAITILFEGSLLWTKPVPQAEEEPYFKTVEGTFKVHQVYKGDLGAQVRVLYWPDSGGNCGISFKPYESVVIAAHGNPETGYTTNLCLGVDYEPFRSQALDAARRYQDGLEGSQ